MELTKEQLKQIIGEAMGAGSLCWEPKPSGVFTADEASALVDKMADDIVAKYGE